MLEMSSIEEDLEYDTLPVGEKYRQLVVADRCDRCGAQAYVRAILVSGGQLLFCSHHAKSYAEGLKPVAAVIQDETQKLANQAAN